MNHLRDINPGFAQSLIGFVARRHPADEIIGGRDNPYLLRWYLTPHNPDGNTYLHHFLRSDDDRALHDHPWDNTSIVLCGEYIEHTIAAGGIHNRVLRKAGDVFHRRAEDAHRIELVNGDPAWTLFLTGPKRREWGFHCPEAGWVHWRDFCAPDDAGAVGPGCGA